MARYLILLTLFLISGCATALDERQVVTDSNLGVIFFADVVAVYAARTDSFSPNRYQSVAEEAAALESEKRNINDPVGFARTSLARAIAGTLVGDAEARINNTKCLYIVNTTDKRITDAVATTVLNSYGDTDVVFVGDFPGSRDSRDGFESDFRYGNTNQFVEELVSVAQSCDARIKPGKQVFLTYTTGGATIHLPDDNMKQLRSLWEGKILPQPEAEPVGHGDEPLR